MNNRSATSRSVGEQLLRWSASVPWQSGRARGRKHKLRPALNAATLNRVFRRALLWGAPRLSQAIVDRAGLPFWPLFYPLARFAFRRRLVLLEPWIDRAFYPRQCSNPAARRRA